MFVAEYTFPDFGETIEVTCSIKCEGPLPWLVLHV